MPAVERSCKVRIRREGAKSGIFAAIVSVRGEIVSVYEGTILDRSSVVCSLSCLASAPGRSSRALASDSMCARRAVVRAWCDLLGVVHDA